MKNKNQTEQRMLELAHSSAANEDSFPAGNPRDAAPVARKQGWDPYEVWRTRVRPTAGAAGKGSAQA